MYDKYIILDTNPCVNINNGMFITYAKKKLFERRVAKKINKYLTRCDESILYIFPHCCAHLSAPRSNSIYRDILYNYNYI